MSANLAEFREVVKRKQKRFRLMGITIGPLEADLKFARAQLEKDPASQFWRRTAIRCLLALADALLWNLKRIATLAASALGNSFTPKELEKLEEKGRFLPFAKSVKTTFSSFGKAYGFAFEPKYDQDFDALCKTYELRNRLMHPKDPFDPNVSDSDCEAAWKGADWLLREYRSLIPLTEEKVEQIKKATSSRDAR